MNGGLRARWTSRSARSARSPARSRPRAASEPSVFLRNLPAAVLVVRVTRTAGAVPPGLLPGRRLHDADPGPESSCRSECRRATGAQLSTGIAPGSKSSPIAPPARRSGSASSGRSLFCYKSLVTDRTWVLAPNDLALWISARCFYLAAAAEFPRPASPNRATSLIGRSPAVRAAGRAGRTDRDGLPHGAQSTGVHTERSAGCRAGPARPT